MSNKWGETSLRDDLIQRFIDSRDIPLSGEQLSQALGVSRTAIWKQIKLLESYGFCFEATTKVGYRLVELPDELMEPIVKPKLKAGAQFGCSIRWMETLASTNETLVEFAKQDAPSGTVVTTSMQEGGRGRQGRLWSSPKGGMWFSILVRNPCAVAQAQDLTLLASVAVLRGLKRQGVPVEIKWPNDLLVHGKKVCGILAQMRTDGEQVEYAVIGIGINANFDESVLPLELQKRATTLYSAIGEKVDRSQVLADILTELEKLYGALKLGHGGFSQVIDEWRGASSTLGRYVEVKMGNTLVQGKAVEIDARGTLVVEDSEGVRHEIYSGEILFTDRERV